MSPSANGARSELLAMNDQLALFTAPVPVTAEHDRPGNPLNRDPAWPHATWRFGSGRGIEYRHPEPTTPPPAAVLGGAWQWNPLVPGWRLDYPRPPFSLAPKGVASDRHGPKLLPPPGFLEIDRRRLAGRCPHCGRQSDGCWGGPGWHGWSDPRVAAAFEMEEAAGRHCYGLTVVDVPELGPLSPLSHYSRWGAGHCSACGAISWNDFRDPSSAYYRPPVTADGP